MNVKKEKYIFENCKYHGLIKFRYDSKSYRCIKCSSEAVQRRRDKLKLLSIQYKGSKCAICGYDKCIEALEFHHIDPNKKEFGIAAKGYTRSFEKIKKELDKCVLLCANCHREIHSNMNQ